jgi:hypothetical protein
MKNSKILISFLALLQKMFPTKQGMEPLKKEHFSQEKGPKQRFSRLIFLISLTFNLVLIFL